MRVGQEQRRIAARWARLVLPPDGRLMLAAIAGRETALQEGEQRPPRVDESPAPDGDAPYSMPRRIVVAVNDTDGQQLDELAARAGITQQQWLRRAIRVAWARSLRIPHPFRGPVKATPRPKL